MNVVYQITKRNVKLYLRDRSAVFFSFLSTLIIIVLYMLFLADVYVSNVSNAFAESGFKAPEGIEAMIIIWILGGILVLNSLSIPQALLSRIVIDRDKNTLNDFYVSSFKREKLALSYILSAIIIGVLMTVTTFFVGQIILYSLYGYVFSISIIIKVICSIILVNGTFSALLFFLYIFIKNSSALSGLSAFISSVGGFLAGVYISIGDLSGIAQKAIAMNPLAHATALFRNVMMEDIIGKTFADLPSGYVLGIKDSLGINLYFNDYMYTTDIFIINLIAIFAICVILSYIKIKKDKIN